jgi:hypothetical protein
VTIGNDEPVARTSYVTGLRNVVLVCRPADALHWLTIEETRVLSFGPTAPMYGE